MEIIWTQEALERISDIQNYLAVKQQSPRLAENVIKRLLARLPQIQELPFSGRKVPDYQDHQVREQIEKPYRIIYLIKDQKVFILSVMHQRQLLPKLKKIKAPVVS